MPSAGIQASSKGLGFEILQWPSEKTSKATPYNNRLFFFKTAGRR
jgi:hypothetical protein